VPDVKALIDQYFITMEWPFEAIDEGLWRCFFQGDIQLHDVFVSADEPGWVSFRSPVCPPVPEASRFAVYEHLLRLNALVPLTKFCVLDDGQVFAMIDLPVADLDFSEFRTAVETLVNHADAFDNEIFRLAGLEPSVAPQA
jgi:hypothetical protein